MEYVDKIAEKEEAKKQIGDMEYLQYRKTGEPLYRELLDKKPEMWFLSFRAIVSTSFIEDNGFNNIYEFVTTDVSSHGLGMTENQFLDLIEFNPDYKKEVEEFKATVLSKAREAVDTLGEVGKDSKNENRILGGTNNDYRIAKLKRDYPDVADRLINGEFKSVSAAERAAGISRPLKTPLEKLMTAYDKLSEEDKNLFKEYTL